jgi:molybdenum cofactor biosynthesis enzyme MoaA
MKLEEIGFYSLSDERAKNTNIDSQMKRTELIITEYCNFSCSYCRGLKDEIYGNRKSKQLSLDEIKKIIDYWCENQPLENIRFSGGEPTLHKDIIEIVRYVKNKGINRIAISTNGSNKLELYKKLIIAGVNDFSISLDACCAEDGDKLAGNVKGSWNIVVDNIRELSKLTYVTVGIVLFEDNIDKTIETIKFADELGVSDIRIISSAQFNKAIPKLNEISEEIKNKYPILRYRINNFANGLNVRGLDENDCKRCALVLDDSVIAGDFHYPCVIAMREGSEPIGKVGPNMRQERFEWFKNQDVTKNEICKKNCLDVCRDFNNIVRELNDNLIKYM